MRQSRAPLILFLSLSLAATSCDSGKSGADLREEIRLEAERLNSCESVDDCLPVGVDCSSIYVNRNADRKKLEALTAELKDRFGPQNCILICACGVLRCQARKCTTSGGTCMGAPSDGKEICL